MIEKLEKVMKKYKYINFIIFVSVFYVSSCSNLGKHTSGLEPRYLNLPNRTEVERGDKASIDGLWVNQNGVKIRIEKGAMYFDNPAGILPPFRDGDVIGRNIKKITNTKYTLDCLSFKKDSLIGSFGPGEIEVISTTTLSVTIYPNYQSGILNPLTFKLKAFSLADPEWFTSEISKQDKSLPSEKLGGTYPIKRSDGTQPQVTEYKKQTSLPYEDIFVKWEVEMDKQRAEEDRYRTEKEAYKDSEADFLRQLSDTQLENYSNFTEARTKSDNAAKSILSYRQLIDSLNEDQKQRFVEIYSKGRILEEKGAYLDKRGKMLRREGERLLRFLEIMIASGSVQPYASIQTISPSEYNNATSFWNALKDLGKTFERNSEQYRNIYQHQSLIYSLKGIENALRGY